MLSLAVCRSGGALKSVKLQRLVTLLPRQLASTTPTPTTGSGTAVVPDDKGRKDLAEALGPRLKNWKEANDIFYGPDRDFKNFPTLQQQEAAKVRMGMVSENYFQFLQKKTGVLGPYILLFGTGSFLLSKEIVPFVEDFQTFLVMVPSLYFIATYRDKLFTKTMQKYIDKFRKAKYSDPMDNLKNMTKRRIENCELEIWRQDGLKDLFEAKKENVLLQLESEYRRRLQQVHLAVKKRLDYQMEIESMKRRLEQEHMVNWIVSGVLKSITPQQEKDSISNCILNLKKLSAQ